MSSRTPLLLCVLDGFGEAAPGPGNAIHLAQPRFWMGLRDKWPTTQLEASGEAVGLPCGLMGNSEVGHLNIGAGRVVYQEITRIDREIREGRFQQNAALRSAVDHARQKGGTLHLFGLVSDGGVHSSDQHLRALLQMAKAASLAGDRVVLHAFLDGRDTPPRSAQPYLAKAEQWMAELGCGRVGSVIGRYYAMDRDKRWERVKLAYDVMAMARGARFATAQEAVAAAHAAGQTDEFIQPAAIGEYRWMSHGDGLLCFNFRADRVREILSALLDPAFDGFAPEPTIRFSAAAGLTEYSAALNPFLLTLFPPQSMAAILGEVVGQAGLRQLRMAETEKYPHVTYFLNGGEETPYPGEDRIMVPSPKVATYDLQPEMSAPELTEKAVQAIRSGTYDLIVLNFANADMVGHTGSLPAAIKACETVDAGLGRIAEAIAAIGGRLLVTADHGNAELMRDPATGGPHTAHTTNLVPVLLHGAPAGATLADGRLADLAPTLLALLGLPQPPEMTGRSLLQGGEGAAAA